MLTIVLVADKLGQVPHNLGRSPSITYRYGKSSSHNSEQFTVIKIWQTEYTNSNSKSNFLASAMNLSENIKLSIEN